MTTAATKAVRQRLSRIRGEREVNLGERLLAIGRDCASHLKEPFRRTDYGEMLYNEQRLKHY